MSTAPAMSGTNTSISGGTDLTSILGNLLGVGATTANSVIGGNNTAAAQVAGEQAGINTLGTTQTNISNLLGTQAQTGNAAMTNLSTYLGLNGQPADFSQFYNTPGYQFAVSQGTNAIQSAAAANGSAYTPNTLASIGNYVQGAASTNYNNYISNLLGTSQLGVSANQLGTTSNLSTGSSIAQLQAAQGSANASGAANTSSSIGNALSALGGSSGIGALLTNLLGGNANASGSSSTLGGLGTAINGLFGGTGTAGSMTSTQLSNLLGNGGLSETNNSAYDTDTSLSNAQLAALYGFGTNDTSGSSNSSNNSGTSSSTDTSTQDYLDNFLNTSFSSAGGQAATTNLGGLTDAPTGLNLNLPTTSGSTATLASGSNLLGGALGVAGGIASGTPTGYASAGLNATKLVSSNPITSGGLGTNASAINTGAGDAINALGIYTGIKTGGVGGDASAAVNAAQLATKGLATTGAISSATAGTALGALNLAAIPLDLYNEVKSYQSGATASDALSGLQTGAAIGSFFGPLGTAIGGVIGAAGGAIASAFGGGKNDPETLTDNNIDQALASGSATAASTGLDSPEGAFQYVTGVMDAKNATAGHSQPIEQIFGREGETSLTNQMASQINSAVSSGQISMLSNGGVAFKTGGGTVEYSAADAPGQIYSQIVSPWLNSKGAAISGDSVDLNGANQGQALQTSLQTLIGSYISGNLNSKTALDSSGQTDSTLPEFLGLEDA